MGGVSKDLSNTAKLFAYFRFPRARCTSAAPGYFKPYRVDRRNGTMKDFIDGGLKLNNPVFAAYNESKRICQAQSSDVIDIILSIGCGRNSVAEQISTSSLVRQKEKVSRWHTMLKLVMYQFEVNTATEKVWTDFKAQQAIPSWQNQRFCRISPDLGYGPPLLDALAEMPKLEITTQKLLEKDLLGAVQYIADMLIASCFYFQRATQQWSESDELINCPGTYLQTRGLRAADPFRNDSMSISQWI